MKDIGSFLADYYQKNGNGPSLTGETFANMQIAGGRSPHYAFKDAAILEGIQSQEMQRRAQAQAMRQAQAEEQLKQQSRQRMQNLAANWQNITQGATDPGDIMERLMGQGLTPTEAANVVSQMLSPQLAAQAAELNRRGSDREDQGLQLQQSKERRAEEEFGLSKQALQRDLAIKEKEAQLNRLMTEGWGGALADVDKNNPVEIADRLISLGMNPDQAIDLANKYAEIQPFSEEGEGTQYGAMSKEKRQEVDNLRKEYTSQLKDYKIKRNAYDSILTIASSGNHSGVNDVALIHSYMRMLDPGGRVTDQDYLHSEGARSIPEHVKGLIQKVLTGHKLTPQQREEIYVSTRDIYHAAEREKAGLDQQYTEIARSRRLPSKFILASFDDPGKSVETLNFGEDTYKNPDFVPKDDKQQQQYSLNDINAELARRGVR